MNKIINGYRNLSKPTKASLWFIVSNVILKGISFFTLPIFARLLTPAEYGVVSVYNSWVATISIITTLTIWGGVFNVGMVKFENEQRKMISSFQGLATSITLLFSFLSSFFLDTLSEISGLSNLLIVCMYIEILAQIPFNIWSTEQRYRFEYKKLIIVTCLIAILSPLMGIVAVNATNFKAEARIMSNLLLLAIIGCVLFFVNQIKGKSFFSKQFWEYGFKFSIVLVPHYLSTQILNQSDRIMINSMCGSSDAGIYSVAYNFALLLSLVTNGINSSLTPHIYQCMKAGDTRKLKKETTFIVLLVALMALCLICFVPDLFIFMLPESYYPALRVIPPVTVGAYFLFLYPLFGSIEFYYEEKKYVTYASVIGAMLNVALNYMFIQSFGFIAAAYTTLICYLCFSICHFYFMNKILRKNGEANDIYDIKSIFIISLGLTIASLVMLFLYDYMIIRWGVIMIISLGIICNRKKIISIVKNIKKRD